MAKHIYRRGDTYYVRLMLDGKRFNRSLETSVLAEAKRKAPTVERDILQEAHRAKRSPSGQVHTLSSFWEDCFEPDCLSVRQNEKGQKIAKARFNTYIAPTFADFRLDQIKRPDLLAFAAGLTKKDLSPQSQKHVLSLLRSILNYAHEAGEMGESAPSFRKIMPKIPEALPRRHSEAQMQAILAAANPLHRLILELLYTTGIRYGEALRLEVKHVKLGDNPRLELDNTKSGKVRRVPLSPEAVAAVKALLKWPHRVGTYVLPIRSKNPCYLYRNAQERVGFKWSAHGCRHTFACTWIERGGSLAGLQEILGHSSVVITQRYARLREQATDDEARHVFGGISFLSGTKSGTKAETKKRKASK